VPLTFRRRIEGLLDGLHLPSPLDVDALTRHIAATRGRPILLVPHRELASPCGLWIALPDVDMVFYEAETSGRRHEHAVLHQLGHVVCGHTPVDPVPAHVVAQMLPNLDPGLAHTATGRSSYAEREEREADLAASLVMRHAGDTFITADEDAPPSAGIATTRAGMDGEAILRLSLVFGATGGVSTAL
jgi:hypothetical protein